MKIQTLIATIDQTDQSLAQRMNVQTDCLIGNQCGANGTEEVWWNGHRVIYLNTAERGVGRNRNLLLEQAEAEFCVFADDDMCFLPGYPKTALRCFAQCPKADLLVFNLVEKDPRRYRNRRIFRVHWYNYARYGAARLAFRRKSLINAGIRFDLRFGGGAEYGSGEDTLFLRSCLKKGLKIYAIPEALAEIDQEAKSTWFTSYNSKFFRDKGALYACLHPILWRPYALRYLIRYRKKLLQELRFREAYSAMKSGRALIRKQEDRS